MLRAAGQRHLQLSPLAKVEFKPGIEYAAKLDRRCATNTRAQGLGWRKSDRLKVVDPADVDPRSRCRVERKPTSLSWIEDIRAYASAIYCCRLSASTQGAR